MWTAEISDLRPQIVQCPECHRRFSSIDPLFLVQEIRASEGETTGWEVNCPVHGAGTVFND